MAHADPALYVAKREGKDRAVSYETALAERATLEAAIRTAVDVGQFELHYQPVVDARSGTVVALEALLRWDRPGHGTVLPGAFLAVAERSELGHELDRLALRQACAQLAAWISSGLDSAGGVNCSGPLRVSVNLSGRHLADPAVVNDVENALDASGLAPERLWIELTETALERPLVHAHVQRIRSLGVSAALDDFGTGSTSLADLGRLPVDTVKIDASFLTSSQPGQPQLLRLLVGAVHAFGLQVGAEGVEDLHVLTGLGCDLAQGYALGRPMPAGVVPGWLRGPRSPGSAT